MSFGLERLRVRRTEGEVTAVGTAITSQHDRKVTVYMMDPIGLNELTTFAGVQKARYANELEMRADGWETEAGVLP